MISEKSIMLCYGIHVSSSWWCMPVPRVSANKAYKKNCFQEFPILLALNYYTFMCTCDFYRNEHIILHEEGISKHSGKQENFAVVTCLILNMELNMRLIGLMEFASI